MAAAALIISIVSALGAVAAVWVSVWTHRQQGSRVECVWSNAFPVYGADLGDRHIQVQAINHGRSATTISSWGLEIIDAQGKPTDSTIVIFKLEAWQPALPHRLESESSAGWMMSFEELQETLAKRTDPVSGLIAYVQTGTGRRIYSAKPVDPNVLADT
jgi:hypothetical protein